MADPADPAAAAVASLLKSLRTRTGLREDRLNSTELALDALTGLERVRGLLDTSTSILQAIVRAVRAAASSLEPTMSIIADVSLGLELSADSISDADLYADDLADRRVALLANWDRLHELRSVSPAPRPPTLRSLRLHREAEALHALAMALTTAARPELTEPTIALRRPVGQSGQPILLQVLQDVSRALRGRLIRDSAGQPQGWPHDLRRQSEAATPLATAYGLKAMLLLDEQLTPDLIPVVLNLREMARPGGGYATRTQSAARPEATATVLDALHRIDSTATFDNELSLIAADLGDFERRRPFILSTVLETCIELQPDSELTTSLIDDLLAIRRSYDRGLLWSEKAEQSLISPAPSTVHTARAVCVLAQVQAVRPAAKVHEAIDQAREWLISQHDIGNVGELIDRELDQGVEPLYIRHFGAAWLAKALVSVGLPVSHPAVSAAVSRVWRSYHPTEFLWTWINGDVPIWMTLDAIESLRMTALATTIPTGLSTES